MENIYSMIDDEKRKIERENFLIEEELANDNINFIFSSKPRMTIIKQEILREIFE